MISANQYFNENLSDEKIKSSYSDLFKKIQKQMQIYK